MLLQPVTDVGALVTAAGTGIATIAAGIAVVLVLLLYYGHSASRLVTLLRPVGRRSWPHLQHG